MVNTKDPYWRFGSIDVLSSFLSAWTLRPDDLSFDSNEVVAITCTPVQVSDGGTFRNVDPTRLVSVLTLKHNLVVGRYLLWASILVSRPATYTSHIKFTGVLGYSMNNMRPDGPYKVFNKVDAIGDLMASFMQTVIIDRPTSTLQLNVNIDTAVKNDADYWNNLQAWKAETRYGTLSFNLQYLASYPGDMSNAIVEYDAESCSSFEEL